jgi:hypothetical protein
VRYWSRSASSRGTPAKSLAAESAVVFVPLGVFGAAVGGGTFDVLVEDDAPDGVARG